MEPDEETGVFATPSPDKIVAMAAPDPVRVDGIAVFCGAAEPDALQRVSLIVRAGAADETLPTAGTIELLGLYVTEIDAPPYVSVGMSLDHYFLTIDVAAPPEDLKDILAAITARMRAPDPEELCALASLIADDDVAAANPVVEALTYRYGATGPGLQSYRGMGLAAFNVATALDVARRAFARDNVVVVSEAPLPSDLSIELAAGSRWVAADPVPLALDFPVGYPHSSSGEIILSATAPHGAASLVASRVLTARVVTALRHELGMVYSPHTIRIPFVHHDLIGVQTDVPDQYADTAVKKIFDAVQALAAWGPNEEELAAEVISMARQVTSGSTRSLPWVQGRQFLADEPPQTQDDLLAELQTVTPEQVQRVIDAMIDTAMLGVPGKTKTNVAALNWDRGPEDPRIGGRRYDPRKGLYRPGTMDVPVYFVSLDGRQLYRGAQHGTTVTFDEVAAMFAWRDGARRLIRPDGYAIPVEPSLVTRGHELIQTIDAAVPSERVIWQPPREPDAIPQSPSALERVLLRAPLTLAVGTLLTSLVLLVLALPGAVGQGTARELTLFIPMLAMFALNVFWSKSESGYSGYHQPSAGPSLTHPAMRGPQAEKEGGDDAAA